MEESVNNFVQQLVEGDKHWFVAPSYIAISAPQRGRTHLHDVLGFFFPLVLRDCMLNHGRTVHVAEPPLILLSWLFKRWRRLSNA